MFLVTLISLGGMGIRKIISGIAAVLLGTAGVVGIGATGAEPASAATCGYSLINEETPPSNFHWDLPIIGEIDLGGGGQTVTFGHFGNCSNENVQISVTTTDGKKNLCVTPGDTRLGISAESNGKVQGATQIGAC